MFQDQMIKEFDPMVYLFTRTSGSLNITPMMPLSRWIESGDEIDFGPIDD